MEPGTIYFDGAKEIDWKYRRMTIIIGTFTVLDKFE